MATALIVTVKFVRHADVLQNGLTGRRTAEVHTGSEGTRAGDDAPGPGEHAAHRRAGEVEVDDAGIDRVQVAGTVVGMVSDVAFASKVTSSANAAGARMSGEARQNVRAKRCVHGYPP